MNCKAIKLCSLLAVLLVGVILFLPPEVGAALRPYNYMGRITRVDTVATLIEIETEFEWQNGEWKPHQCTIEGKAPEDALKLKMDDYVEAASLGLPGELWTTLAKVKSPADKTITAIYGDPVYLMSDILLGGYTIEYESTPECSTWGGGTNCTTKYVGLTIAENGHQVGTAQLGPGQNHLYTGEEYHIEITFHSGETSAYPECTNLPVPGPQSVSDFTIRITEADQEEQGTDCSCLGSFLVVVFLFSSILIFKKK